MKLRLLLTVVIALIIHGSLHPWEFRAPSDVSAAVVQMFKWNPWTGLGDTVGNVLLFVPLGLLSAAIAGSRAQIALYVALSTVFALMLQLLQVWLPSRDAEMSDVFWNVVGISVGVSLQSVALAGLSWLHVNKKDDTGLRLAVCVLWIGLECWPLVPTLDLQHVKDAAKPLLLHPTWNWLSAVETSTSVFVVGFALRDLHRSKTVLGCAVLSAILAKFVFVGAVLSLSHTIGLISGLLAASAAHRWRSLVWARTTLLLALAWTGLDELRPFELSLLPNSFQFIPFQSMLDGSLEANLLTLIRSLFWTGSVMLSAVSLGIATLPAAVTLSTLLLLLEAGQVFLPGRTPDITLAVLPFIWALFATRRPLSGEPVKVKMPSRSRPRQS